MAICGQKYLFGSSSSSPPQPPIPSEYICGICSQLMSEPILTRSSHFLDMSCIQACQQLNFIPPHLENLSSHRYPFSWYITPWKLALNLQAAIHHWRKDSGHPFPTPTSESDALYIVRSLKSTSSPSPPLPLLPPRFFYDPVREQRILRKLNSNLVFRKLSGLCSLIEYPLCSPRILAAIINLLNFPHPTVRQCAARTVCRLSRCPKNRAHVLRSGVVPVLVTLLNREEDHRAVKAVTRTFHNLTADKSCCIAIGAMGVIPPLLDKFCGYFRTHSGWEEVASTLYRLTDHCQENLEVFAENEGVRKLIETAGDEKAPREMRRHALELLRCLVKMERGRDDVLKNGGCMRMLVKLGKDGEGVGLASLTLCRELRLDSI